MDRLPARLGLLAVGLALSLGACGPAWRSTAAPPPPASVEADARRFLGVWALSDNDNVLFNLRLEPDGSATTAAGSRRAAARLEPLSTNDLLERGRWRGWGNGVRIDYNSGWSDTLLLSPAGLVQWSWAPGADRNAPPSNHGKAVRVEGPLAAVVGVYRIQPAEMELPPYTASLLSNGQAFNSIDAIQGGSWRLEGQAVTIDWASRWRTVIELGPGPRLRCRIWKPGIDRQGPPTAIRTAERVR